MTGDPRGFIEEMPPAGYPPFKILRAPDFHVPAGCWPVGPDSAYAAKAQILVWSSNGVFNDPSDLYAWGSAFWVAGSLVATAKHNIDGMADILTRNGERQFPGEYRFGMGIVDPNTFESWVVDQEMPLPGSYISLLRLRPFDPDMTATPIEPPALRFSDVRIGEALTCAGFARMTERYDEKLSIEMHRKATGIEATCFWGTGSVTRSKKGVGRCDYLEVQGLEAAPGMSGGPVRDDRGRIVGVVSRSMVGGNYTLMSTWPAELRSAATREHVGKARLDLGDGDVFTIKVDNGPGSAPARGTLHGS
jgi:hypothetical protein